MIQNCCVDATNVAQQQPCLMHPYGQTDTFFGGSTADRPRDAKRPRLGEECPPRHGGRRESRMLVAPAASCATKSTRVGNHRFNRSEPAFPARVVLTAASCSLRCTGLFSHRRRRITVCRTHRADIAIIQGLIPASGGR